MRAICAVVLGFGLGLAGAIDHIVISPAAAATAKPAPAWAKGTPWMGALDWADRRLTACREASGYQRSVACDRFVAEAVDRVFGAAEFKDGTDYVLGRRVVGELSAGHAKWRLIGTAGDQKALDEARARADAGAAVVAVLRGSFQGQLALVLPGPGIGSKAWKRRVPNAASLFRDNNERSFIGRPLSFAFSSTKMAEVSLYVREAEAMADSADAAPSIPGRSEETEDEALGSLLSEFQSDAPVQQRDVEPALGPEDATAATATAPDEVAPEAPVPAAEEPTAPKEEVFVDVKVATPPPTAVESEATPGPRGDELDPEKVLNARVSGTWCKSGIFGSKSATSAVLIDGYGKKLSWGVIERANVRSFRATDSKPILGMIQEGEIIGITFPASRAANTSYTAFFIMVGFDTLFESHVFDNESHQVFEKNLTWRRCADQVSSLK